jgi:Icc-related predicted phosphoesterase
MIADTHGTYPLELLAGLEEGMLIIAGDLLDDKGDESRFKIFIKWLSEARLIVKHIVLIAGNHDGFIYENEAEVRAVFKNLGVHYLRDSMVQIEGLNIYGLPWTERYGDWYFQLSDRHLKKKIDAIPQNVDILITHMPPFGILDLNAEKKKCGNHDLLKKVWQVNPLLHVFGHIHPAGGARLVDRTWFVNAGVMPPLFLWQSSEYLYPFYAKLIQNEDGRWAVEKEVK